MASVFDLVKLFTTGSLSKDEILKKVSSHTISSTQASVSSSQLMLTHRSFQFSEEDEAQSEEETEETPVKVHQPVRPSSQNSQRTVSTSKPDRFDEFYKRQLSWQIRNKLTKASLQNRKLRSSMKSCNSKPKQRPEVTNPVQVFKRLSGNKDYTQFETIKRRREEAKEAEEMAHCTFAPEISPNSRQIQRNLSGTRSQPMISQRTGLMLSKNECTFQPNVSPLKKTMEKAKDYLTDDAFRRLYKLKSTALHPKEVAVPSVKAPTQYHSGQYYPELERPFFERQALYEIKKKEKADAQLRMTQVSSPRINEASKLMVRTDFETRNLTSRSREQEEEVNPECTFRPQITEVAKSMRSRSHEERCHGDAEKRQLNLEKLKAVRAQLEREKAKSSMIMALSPRNVQSNLKVWDHPETYVDRLNERSEEKSRCISQIKTERSARELDECTFSPKVNKYPRYLKNLD
mmetsp:Transcript_25692/g.45016  ORF Transcript_25692/g.45016 Transcript_25692/m.45016 type:complete len:461 (-) Transcript_25692:161-1543(-)